MAHTPGPLLVLPNDEGYIIDTPHEREGADGALAYVATLGDALLYAAASDLLAALRLAQEDTCSLHCPSVRKADQEWTHSERCRAISAVIAKVETIS